MEKERKNEAIWNIFRERGGLMAVCVEMTFLDENEFYDEIESVLASAVEARERAMTDTVKRLREDNKIALDCGQIERHIWAGFDEACKYFLSIINPSKE